MDIAALLTLSPARESGVLSSRCLGHVLTPVAPPDPSSDCATDTLAVAPVPPPELRTDADELRRDGLVRWLEAHGQMSAADTVWRDWDDFVTFYDFPAEHWIHLRTSNPIDSLFARVRLRPDVAKRMRRSENALDLVFKVAQRLGHSWRPLNGGLTVMTLLLGGERFVDGVYVSKSAAVSAA